MQKEEEEHNVLPTRKDEVCDDDFGQWEGKGEGEETAPRRGGHGG